MSDVYVALWLPGRWHSESDVVGVYLDAASAKKACQAEDDRASGVEHGDEAHILEWESANARFTALDGEMAKVPEGYYVIQQTAVSR